MIALLLALASAGATTYTVDVCARIDIDFADVDAANGDDYMRYNTSEIARGVHIRVEQRSLLPHYTWATVYDGYASEDGGTGYGGCLLDRSLDSSRVYRAVIFSEALVNGQAVSVFQDDIGTTLTTTTSATFSPTSNADWTTTTSEAFEDWNLFAAGVYAVWRDDLGNASGDVVIYSEPCPVGGGSCWYNGAAYVSDTVGAYDHKYQVAHEVGHVLMMRRYYGLGSNNDNDPEDADQCFGNPAASSGSSHYFISKEYQGAAFWEGFANYYATASFNNNTTQSDCAFGIYKDLDWDRDLDKEGWQFIDCAGDPSIQDNLGETPSEFLVEGQDYVGEYCSTGTLNNRGTEFDWVEFLWRLDAGGYGMAPEDIADIYVEARTNGGGWESTGNGTGSGYPGYELQQAAARLNSSWGIYWGYEDDVHGVHR